MLAVPAAAAGIASVVTGGVIIAGAVSVAGRFFYIIFCG